MMLVQDALQRILIFWGLIREDLNTNRHDGFRVINSYKVIKPTYGIVLNNFSYMSTIYNLAFIYY